MKITLKEMLNLIVGGDKISIHDGMGEVRFNGTMSEFWIVSGSFDEDFFKAEVSCVRAYHDTIVILLK